MTALPLGHSPPPATPLLGGAAAGGHSLPRPVFLCPLWSGDHCQDFNTKNHTKIHICTTSIQGNLDSPEASPIENIKKWTGSLYSPPQPSHPWEKNLTSSLVSLEDYHQSATQPPNCISQCSPFQRPLGFPRTFQLRIGETKFSSYPSIEATYCNRLSGELDMRIQSTAIPPWMRPSHLISEAKQGRASLVLGWENPDIKQIHKNVKNTTFSNIVFIWKNIAHKNILNLKLVYHYF